MDIDSSSMDIEASRVESRQSDGSAHSDHNSDSDSDSDTDSTASGLSGVARSFPNSIAMEKRLHTPNGLVISQERPPAGPAFGSIAVTSCADVHFGNKTYYKGPVTIKQFLYGEHPAANRCEALSNEGFESDEKDPQNKGGNSLNVNGNVVNTDDTPHRQCKGTQLLREFWEKWRMKERRKALVLGGIVLGALLAIFLCTLFFIQTKGDKTRDHPFRPSEDDNKNIPIKTDIGSTLLSAATLRLISRQEWLAQPPEQPANELVTPVPFVIITHTATENCTDQASCTFHVRFIQTFHMESRNWWDIGYNFLIGGDGSAYEGRGWDSEGAHTKGYNSRSIGIAFIGTFNNIKPPERQMMAAKKLIEEGVRLGKIAPDYKLFGHRQLIPSLSPGDELFNDIKTWPHWTNSTLTR